MGVRVGAVIACALAGCYAPSSFSDCAITCTFGVAATCPEGSTCGESNRCSPTGAGCPGDSMYDAPIGDGDGPPPGADCHGRGSLLKELCPTRAPLPSITLSDINTTSDPLCELIEHPSGQPTLCVVHARVIQVVTNDTVNVTGTHPLVLFADDRIVIDGRLDASSDHSDLELGAGRRTTCVAPGGASSNTALKVGAGGAGATFAGVGGRGGGALGVMTTQPITTTVPFPTELHGGCTGGPGGVGTGGNNAGPGGEGGGVLYLVANNSIDVAGLLVANGASAYQDGVAASEANGGGGGGGSGGLIVLDAPQINFAIGAKLIAVGGSGGGGSSSDDRGLAGGDPDIGTNNPALLTASGGNGGLPSGASGGAGSSVSTSDGVLGQDAVGMGGGGGGGGGAAGFIIAYCTPGTCPVYPTFTVPGGRNVNP